MKRYDSAFSSAATRVNSAAKKTTEDYAKGYIPDEPNFTATLVTRIKDLLTDYSKGGISWTAKILTSHGPNTEETKFGADLLGALNLDLPGYSVRKGFLAQAKRQEEDESIRSAEWSRMQRQCNTMLNHTSESYVFVYGLSGVFVVPAISVAACSNVKSLYMLHPKRLSAFYKEHFTCFIGDRRIDNASGNILDNLLAGYSLELSATAATDLFSGHDGDA
jgi:hypothetical protein